MPRKKQTADVINLVSSDEDDERPGPSSHRRLPASVDEASPEDAQQAEKGSRKRKKAEGSKSKGKAEKRQDAAGRTVRWSAKPSQQVRERIARAMPGSGHRLFLIDRKVLAPIGAEGGAAEEFAVLGATGNVYSVTICRQPQCTCPDFLKGNLCKHILFVMLRVLRLPRNEPLVWQRALLTQEVDEILGGQKSSAAGGDNVLAGVAVRDQFRRMSSQGAGPSGQQEGGSGANNQRPVEGDCPICFDALEPNAASADDKITFCAGSCGNNVHVGCIRRWISNERSQGLQATCPLCRAPWLDGLNPAPAGQQPKQYTNLAQYSTAHQGADTSLEALYGDRSVWIRANQGDLGRRQAANMWRTMQGGW